MKSENKKLELDEHKGIILLNQLIRKSKNNGLTNTPSNCDDLGVPILNTLYVETYKCIINQQLILALCGVGIFLEEFTKFLWISNKFHEQQKMGKFNNWDESMEFKKIKMKEIENQKISYQKDIRPILEKELDINDLESIELLREIVRNTFVHSKRIYLIELLQKYKLLPETISIDKVRISDKGLSEPEKAECELTHPVLLSKGFEMIAAQIAPAMLIFIYDLFKKYHAKFAPLPDKKLGFSGIE